MRWYEPVHDRFARFCQTRLGNNTDAKDLISETVLVAYENLHTLRQPEAFLYFLFGIASRLIKKKARRRKFWGLFQEQESIQVRDANLSAEASADIEILYRALNQLPEAQKEALLLFEIAGFSLKEIQEIQQASLSAVKLRLVRGRKALGQLLHDSETESFFPKEVKSAAVSEQGNLPASVY